MCSTVLPTTTISVSLRGGSTVRPVRGVSADTFSIGHEPKSELNRRVVGVLRDQRHAAPVRALEQPDLGLLEPPLDLLLLILLLAAGLPIRVHPHAVRVAVPIQLLSQRRKSGGEQRDDGAEGGSFGELGVHRTTVPQRPAVRQ